jgi:SAM-dependent methyltransferase
MVRRSVLHPIVATCRRAAALAEKAPVEPFKFTRIAHADHLFHSPISPEKLAVVLGLAQLAPGARVIDFGCGNAEVLIGLVEQYDITGVGIDHSPVALAEARHRAAGRIAEGSLELGAQSARDYLADPGSFDLALCIGATDALGGLEEAVGTLARFVRPGGHLVIGECYWKRPPAPVYLEALGATADDYRAHGGNVALGVAQGLRYLYAAVSSDDDWDHYEGLYCRGIERYVAAHPDDADGPAMLRRIRAWRDLYLEHGRETLGFALYLFGL